MAQSHRGARAVGRWVLAGFVGMLLSFAVAMLSTQLLAADIHRAADQIVTNGSPSVRELAAARTELRHLEVALDDALDRHLGGSAMLHADARAVARDRELVVRHWRAYRALRFSPEERALWPAAEASLSNLSSLVDTAIQERDSAIAQQTAEAAKLATDRLDESISRLQDLNLAADAHLATTINETWRRSRFASGVAISLVMIITLLTAWAVVRLVRHSARTLEDRANEYEAFAGRVAHDLANPIAAATMTIELAHETVARSSPSVDPLLDRISATLRRASTLLDDLHRYAEAGHVGGTSDRESRADVSEVLRGVVDQVRPSAIQQHVEISLEDSTTATVACRPGVLISIMTNLVDNALKHMGHSVERRVALHVRMVRNSVRIEVEDFGPGIAPAIIGHIFEPYVRGSTSAPGLGLGLATVKRLTEGHGGTVGVRSSVGKGSVFWCELPKAHQARA
jgi:signal transduction histidine kinase